MRQILLVEDSEEGAFLVKSALGKFFRVLCAPLASEALQLLDRNAFDLILLDVVLPDGDGFHLCAKLQSDERTRDIPIIFLTGRSEVTDKVMGFSLGADDYLVKPFESAELRARIEAKLSKLSYRKMSEESILKGDLRINVSFQKAFLKVDDGEKDLHLTPTEFKLLHYFVRNEGHVLSRSQLLTAIWGDNLEVYDRIIDKHISSLRQKMSSKHCRIETIPRTGYRFSGPSAQE